MASSFAISDLPKCQARGRGERLEREANFGGVRVNLLNVARREASDVQQTNVVRPQKLGFSLRVVSV